MDAGYFVELSITEFISEISASFSTLLGKLTSFSVLTLALSNLWDFKSYIALLIFCL